MEFTRKQKGDIAEAEAKIHFIKLGYEVYEPSTDNAKYDLLVSDGGKILRVSIKFCNSQHKSGSWKVTMSNTSRRIDRIQTDLFDSSLYDLIAVYVYQEDRVVVVPASKATPNILTIPKEV